MIFVGRSRRYRGRTQRTFDTIFFARAREKCCEKFCVLDPRFSTQIPPQSSSVGRSGCYRARTQRIYDETFFTRAREKFREKFCVSDLRLSIQIPPQSSSVGRSRRHRGRGEEHNEFSTKLFSRALAKNFVRSFASRTFVFPQIPPQSSSVGHDIFTKFNLKYYCNIHRWSDLWRHPNRTLPPSFARKKIWVAPVPPKINKCYFSNREFSKTFQAV